MLAAPPVAVVPPEVELPPDAVEPPLDKVPPVLVTPPEFAVPEVVDALPPVDGAPAIVLATFDAPPVAAPPIVELPPAFELLSFALPEHPKLATTAKPVTNARAN
jgi:hypothetical protein